MAVVNYEFEVASHKNIIDTTKYKNPMTHPRINCDLTMICRFTISLTTFVAICCVCLGRYHRLNWQNEFISGTVSHPSRIKYMHYQDEDEFIENNKDEFGNVIKERFFNKILLFEIIMLALHPIPFYDRYVIFSSKN